MTLLYLGLFFKSMFLGLLVTAPVGPVGALVIRASLKKELREALLFGFGAALADSFFALVAALGVSAVENLISENQRGISLTGGVLLLIMGTLSLRKNFLEKKNQVVESSQISKGAKLRDTTATFFITLTNPVTVVGFAAVFAAFGFRSGGAPLTMAFVVVLGVFAGAMAWWSFLSLMMNWVGDKLSKSWILKIQFGTSLLIVVSGFICLARGVWGIGP